MLRRSKKSITGKNIGPNGGNLKKIKPQLTRKIIRRYHFLIQRRQLLCKQLNINQEDSNKTEWLLKKDVYFQDGWSIRGANMKQLDPNTEDKLVKLRGKNDNSREESLKMLGYVMREIKDEGGLANYQLASRMGQDVNRGGDSSKVLVRWMKDMGLEKKLTALEIGSLSKYNQISTCGIFKPVVRIDLNNSNDDDGIIRQDFMKRPLPLDSSEKFDLISCSLVLNFVPTPLERGLMCQRFEQFLNFGKETGYLFIVLPLPCINNSRYMDLKHFTGLMKGLGFTGIQYREAKKVCYFLFQWTDKAERESNQYGRKNKLHDGPSKNNFSIILP